ncbi:hypothetical protein GGS23DRAFT_580635 [Durotheca rogersii]|uniref:uncharacterized protein n=1 Tax=Durotheca rogersii TaxID=419775 RepID=UPI002220C938|nr:uncharacterized protein GGS23DRAFT_580635 [Durotheca rogersii]KAI5860565.1 hypothetical protein GGS23DRAFT_580635 [Durotheca rogersii]
MLRIQSTYPRRGAAIGYRNRLSPMLLVRLVLAVIQHALLSMSDSVYTYHTSTPRASRVGKALTLATISVRYLHNSDGVVLQPGAFPTGIGRRSFISLSRDPTPSHCHSSLLSHCLLHPPTLLNVNSHRPLLYASSSSYYSMSSSTSSSPHDPSPARSRSRSPSPRPHAERRSSLSPDRPGDARKVLKRSLLFLGAVGAASLVANKFWPKGIIYGEKESWASEAKAKTKDMLHGHRKADVREYRERPRDAGGLVDYYADRGKQRAGTRGEAYTARTRNDTSFLHGSGERYYSGGHEYDINRRHGYQNFRGRQRRRSER